MPESNVEWVGSARHRQDAQEIYDAILACADSAGRIFTSVVLRVAADQNSILHSLFEWDDSLAAHQYRLYQVRNVCADFRIRVDGGYETNALVNVVIAGEDRAYYPARVVAETVDLRAAHLANLKKELARMRGKLAGFTEFAKVVQAIDEAL